MATKTIMVPGVGAYVNPEDGNTVMLPGVGTFVNQNQPVGPDTSPGGGITRSVLLHPRSLVH